MTAMADRRRLADEAATFGDILQEGFVDTYANLTIKSLVLLTWFRQNCDEESLARPVPYVMKVDDDTYVNLERLRDIVGSNRRPDLLMRHRQPPKRPNRDPQSKWC